MAGERSLIGQTFSHYRIREELGGGGMGVVYKAEDTRLRRTVSLKFLSPEMLQDSAAIERFRREAQAASSLNHPNICTVYDIGEQEGQHFIVMEFLEGETLKHRISAAALPIKDTIKFALQITDALKAAHVQGIIHRDIKPANLFVTKQNTIKVLDFGLARFSSACDGSVSEMPTITAEILLTSPGSAVGTIAYMSPEQARGEKIDLRTDLFSFGAVLYEMATGRLAFRGKTSAIVHDAILNRTPPLASSINLDLPQKMDEIIAKCLEKERKYRYQSAADTSAALQQLEDHSARITFARSPVKLPRGIGWLTLAGLAILLTVRLLMGGWLLDANKTHALTEKDSIVLADFTNSTGDPVFDGTLRQGFTVQLEQSPFLNLVSEARVQQTLRLMGQPFDARLTPDLAQQLCQRTRSAALLNGSIANLGSQYVIGLKAVNCRTGDSLAQEQVTANGKERVMKALAEAATDLRTKLGESLATVERFNAPLEQVTTPSLEALQAYSLGRNMIDKEEFIHAVPFLERATKLDSSFAMAYASLGVVYSTRSEQQSIQYFRKAHELSGRVSEREKFYIEANYQDFVTGDLEKARQVYELWVLSYPRDEIAHFSLSNTYRYLGQYEKSRMHAVENLEIQPQDCGNYANLLNAYLNLNRLDDARKTADDAKAKQLDCFFLRVFLYRLAFLRKDVAGMVQQAQEAVGEPFEDSLLRAEADTAAYAGHIKQSRQLSIRAVAVAQRTAGTKEAAWHEGDAATIEALFGNEIESKRRAEQALVLSNGRDVKYVAALALALNGSTGRAKALADDLAKRFPEDTMVQSNFVPTLRAQIALSNLNVSRAIEVLDTTRPYELGDMQGNNPLFCIYLRGTAYLAARHGAEASTEFQKIIDHQGVVINSLIGALTYLQIGRAYAMQGSTAKARSAYADFFSLWKDADSDIPVLIAAKAEYAKL